MDKVLDSEKYQDEVLATKDVIMSRIKHLVQDKKTCRSEITVFGVVINIELDFNTDNIHAMSMPVSVERIDTSHPKVLIGVPILSLVGNVNYDEISEKILEGVYNGFRREIIYHKIHNSNRRDNAIDLIDFETVREIAKIPG